MAYVVSLTWDDTASVWVAESADIPGLVLEAESLDALIERVCAAAPELLALNGERPDRLRLFFQSERCVQVV
jgi:predicted RNase H-like HicB family nuclease